MADLISSLPDEIICIILSFLPSRQVVATSVLSKRWNLLWHSVPSLDFDTDNEDFWSLSEKTYNMFYSSVCSLLVRRGDQPLHRFRLRSNFSCDDSERFNKLIKDAVTGSDRLQHLDLFTVYDTLVPSVVFSFKTLVVLKLQDITLEEIFFVDLPLLKILHLNQITSPIEIDLSQLLSGCPNLEDLKVKGFTYKTEGKFNRLPKLVRGSIDNLLLPLEIFKDVEVLFLEWIFQPNLDLDFDFHYLVQLQLNLGLSEDWLLVLKVLNHCPKLQSLVIDIYKFFVLMSPGDEDVWPYPQTVPACISSHLKTCCLKFYSGSKDELQFARYILENAKHLQTMKISTIWGKNNTKGELSSCTKRSDTCTLSFSIY